jgi:hypothetical protein
MQRRYLKIVVILIVLVITAFENSFGQTTSFRLRTADSLFQAGRYTQSFDHYQHILQQKQYTPSMLLKMAFIQEGLLHIGQAMYYLNLYYKATNDKSTLDKMTELAKKYNLEGYETSDANRALSFYQDYHFYISVALGAIMILLLSIAFYTSFRLKRKPAVSFTFIIITILLVAAHFYIGENIATAIITNPSTYVMSGPSAGSSVIEIIGDGHRVEVLGHKDVWMKIEWDGDIAYVKQNALTAISL